MATPASAMPAAAIIQGQVRAGVFTGREPAFAGVGVGVTRISRFEVLHASSSASFSTTVDGKRSLGAFDRQRWTRSPSAIPTSGRVTSTRGGASRRSEVTTSARVGPVKGRLRVSIS